MESQAQSVVPSRQLRNDSCGALHQLRTVSVPRVSETDVAVVIVSWNTRDILRGCLRSVFEQTQRVSFQVFVIDNNSQDSSADMVRAEFPDVTLISNAENRGFAAACNQGMRLASARYVLLLNPDTVVLDDAISNCVRYADLHLDVGVVGCQVLEAEDRITPTGFSFPSPFNLFLALSGLSRAFPHSRLFGRPEFSWWDRRSERDVDVVTGMFMLVRREAIAQVGLMDEAYFVYSEEADWCYRFAQAGWRRVFTPSARIVHLDGGAKSTKQASKKMFVQLQKSAMIYHRKNLGLASWWLLKLIYIASNFVRMVAWFVLSVVKRDNGSWHKSAAAKAALVFHFTGSEPK
ncbi:GT2 family glycosyltransferase [Bradyrhizobium japonicum USDA 38]|uniref:glycosyltransferase family 2 protein n=1 Tax=Bradyrhizobium japonicum TaxID=375 RepID=UPI0009B7A4AF|nr:glycosyltransferase family 2 protein [Bradyrhizobium japonicum]MCS3897841.1 GT2 family glycosyltransferase [Bradyrhizobium japonicum USDA 38]MCS3940895.1 GT2 family glycosyltransferase [Bradyrhizobium japonicum]MCW2217048.1 GT2 family glycosyltransferase [Bradyrhizobium japonicum]MCW2341664.1 GT2 family glycosyltransferase [Bradyrhizobium japonicum]